MAIIITAKAIGSTKIYSKTVKSDKEMSQWIKIKTLEFQAMGITEDKVEFNFIGLR